MDLVAKTSRFPRAGETMHGETFYTSYGGKGANQAVTVARLGAPAVFVGCVGDDAFGKEMLEHLRQERVEIGYVRTVEKCSSGTAVIVVDSEGRNQIIVIRGANERLGRTDVERASAQISAAEVVVIQLEIPFDTVQYAVESAREKNVPVILNPAPAPAGPLPHGILERAQIIVPNEIEAEALTGISASSSNFLEKAVGVFREKGAAKIIITLAEKGCVFSEGEKLVRVPPYEVRAEDTTGAGDAFVGALAAGYGFFPEFKDLIKFASAVAAISVTKRGAQSSLPGRKEVEEFLRTREPALLDCFRAMEHETERVNRHR